MAKSIRQRYPKPLEAAKYLVSKYGQDGGFGYARTREANFGKDSEWWCLVVERIPQAIQELAR